MSKRNITILIAIASLVIVGGLAIFFLTNSEEEASSNNDGASSETANQQMANFNPVANMGESFVATMNGTVADGTTYTATIEYDGENNAHYLGTFNQDEFEIYSLESRYIICSQGQCIESSTNSGIPISTDQYEYTEEDFNAYRDNALYLGRQNCPSGTCEVWQLEENGYSGKLFLDDSGKISRAEWNGAEGNFSIDYEYKEVTITPPENVLTIPNA